MHMLSQVSRLFLNYPTTVAALVEHTATYYKEEKMAQSLH